MAAQSTSTLQRGGVVLALCLLAILVWWAVVTFASVDPFLLPAPGDVLAALRRILGGSEVYSALLVTLREIAAAFAIAAFAGLLLGTPIGFYKVSRNAYEPLLANLGAVPIIVFYPVFTLVLGLGSSSKIAFAALAAYFPVVLSVMSGVGTVDETLVTASRAMGARGRSLVTSVILPGALPQTLNGLRLALVLATLSVVGGEFIGGTAGLGYLLASAGEAFRTVELYAFVVITLAMAAVLYVVMSLVSHLVEKGRYE